MSSYPFNQTLDCQTCGEVIRELTPGQAQQVAEHPERYIVDCRSCQKDIVARLREELDAEEVVR